MDGAIHSASIATLISIGAALLAGFFSMFVAMRSRKGAAVKHDTTMSILCGIAFLLILLNVIAAAFLAVGGMACVGLANATLLLTAAFAVAGMALGLVRGLPNGRAVKMRVA
jgi:hypothetical protein